ncbi:ATP-binding protein [Phyllobacterium myrsinacearum]|uniref:Uncharacterized protein n=1 Tax=Phyllobacterium myrsinacearum TaxID=28101 RepID=A0A839EZB6_9HYPH|nr:hypothetical protein [Phyllobacterium myrsinacearum]MBA8881800.1 hypothetical protein [Phyllobacterium myrsinacearum]
MQVSQLAELDTHAVIGGGKARSFSMSDSAEFFTVLSDTLYRDKKRAVVREVICNGWDAHVMNGCTDKHLEITLTDDEMIIKDFGPGISDDRIVPIYCVYGASTKVKDDAQTGGFGLGSKAPFAYTDHFTVVSCFDEKKIVYAISRGGTATEGKPEIRQMVAVPTQESGITVTIPLREKEDHVKFAGIIRSVVYQGGMKVRLNGQELATVNYEQARKRGYCAILNRNDELREAHVYLLYGTVLYPISTTDPSITVATNHANNLIGKGFKLVLIAPPNSVGVTPSRESLSYSEMTTQTILRLLKRASNEINSSITGAGKKVITRLGSKMTFDDAHFLTSRIHYGGVTNNELIQVDPRQIAAYLVRNNLEKIDASQRRKWIFSGLIKSNRDQRAALRDARYRNIDFGTMRQEQGHRQFVKFASRLGALNEAMIYSDHSEITRGTKRLKGLREAIESEGKFIRTLYLAPNRRELTSLIVGCKLDAMDRSNEFHMGLITGSKPSRDKLDRIRRLAEKFKFTIEEYDFEWQKPKVVRTKAPQETFHNLDDYVEDHRLVEATLTDPKFFIRASTHNDVMRLGINDYSARHMLKKLFPGAAIISMRRPRPIDFSVDLRAVK